MPRSLDELKGIDVNRSSLQSVELCSVSSHRGSSIDLEDEAFRVANRYVRKTPPSSVADTRRSAPYDPAKSPLLLFQPHELHSLDVVRDSSPEDGCPRLPEDLSPSSPPGTEALPLQVYLDTDEKHEIFLMKNHSFHHPEKRSVAHPKGKNPMSEGCSTSSVPSDWVIVDQPSSSYPLPLSGHHGHHGHPLQPTQVHSEPSVLHLDHSESSAHPSTSQPSMYPELIIANSSPTSSMVDGELAEGHTDHDEGLEFEIMKYRRANYSADRRVKRWIKKRKRDRVQKSS